MSRKPTIWIDNDGCPQRVREIVFRAGSRQKVLIRVVANRYMRVPVDAAVEMITVGQGLDAADNYIAEHVQSLDLVVTGDIPLADRVVAKGAVAISPRGTVYDQHSIKEILAMRNLHQELRSAGEILGTHGSLGDNEIKRFAAAFDRSLTQKCKLENS